MSHLNFWQVGAATALLLLGGDGTVWAAGAAGLQTLDCTAPTLGLTQERSVVVHRDGAELHAYWLIADRPELWLGGSPAPDALRRYRDTVRRVVPDVSPLGLIRANREAHPWLEREHPDLARINSLVEGGVGSHRPMNCLETQILAFQTARFPMYEQPSEIVALILARTYAAGDSLKVYVAAGDSTVAPRPGDAIARAEADVAEGWRLVAVFHNHTFNHDPERGHLPVAAPSASDLQISVALAERLGLESILVADGFSTLELTSDEFRRLAEEAFAEDSTVDRARPDRPALPAAARKGHRPAMSDNTLDSLHDRIIHWEGHDFAPLIAPLVEAGDLDQIRGLLLLLRDETERTEARGAPAYDDDPAGFHAHQRRWAALSLLQVLLRRRPGLDGLEVLLELSDRLWTSQHLADHFFEEIADYQDEGTLRALIERHAHEPGRAEQFATLIEKMVARGFDGREHPATVELWRRLDQAGDPLARVSLAPPATAADHVRLVLSQAHWDLSHLDHLVANGRLDLAFEIALLLRRNLPRLEAQIPLAKPNWDQADDHRAEVDQHRRQERALERLEDAICRIPGPDHARRIFDLLETFEPTAQELRKKAAQLADGQDPEALRAAVLERIGHERHREMCALLIHETILRGADWRSVDAAVELHRALEADGHPLGRLPLARLAIEAGADEFLVRFHPGGKSLPYGLPTDEPHRRDAAASPPPPLREITTPEDAERLATFVELWCEESNGEVEARVFLPEAPLAADQITGPLLLGLDLESLEGADADSIQWQEITPERAFGILLSMASSGGAYGPSSYGAYGRERAWRSLAAIVGRDADAPVEAVATEAANCAFAFFAAESDWFTQIMEMGMTCLRPLDGALVVIAVTDTD